MKFASKFKTIGMGLALGLFVFACNQEARQDANEAVNDVQADATEAAADANNNYNDFEAWVNTNTERAETVTADEYREMRTEYNRREAELDAESSTWDEETRQNWEQTKAKWNDFENSVQRRLGNIDDIDVDVDADVQRENN